MANYSELLKDPRWQKKRLEIFNRDAWSCRHCYTGSKTLCVHHILYVGKNPWDTPDKYLVTLCDDCHEMEEILKKANYDFMPILSKCGLTYSQFSEIVIEVQRYFELIEYPDANSFSDFLNLIAQNRKYGQDLIDEIAQNKTYKSNDDFINDLKLKAKKNG